MSLWGRPGNKRESKIRHKKKKDQKMEAKTRAWTDKKIERERMDKRKERQKEGKTKG